MKKDTVIVDTGIIPFNFVKECVEKSLYDIVFLGGFEKKESYEKVFNNNVYYSYNDLDRDVISDGVDISDCYNDIYNRVISDYKTLQIVERSDERRILPIKPWENVFNDLIIVSKLVANALCLLKKYNPKFIFFQATPHETHTWVFAKCAEEMGITVYYANLALLPWKASLNSGLNEIKIVSFNKNSNIKADFESVERFFALNTSSYEKAIPSYEKKRLSKRKKVWSWTKQFKSNLRKPKYFIGLLRKYKIYKLYERLSTTNLNDDKFVVVFLHYQPERTSCPEGKFFSQQYHLIKTISMSLPEGYYVYVKEHPSMFLNDFDIRFRNRDFYESIARLPNVKIVNINIDSFSLLDKSICIATITGTVGIQSMMRGKGVLCFGDAYYKNSRYCFEISDAEDIRKALNILEEKDSKEISRHFLSEMHESDNLSISGVLNEGGDIDDFYNQEYRLNSNGLLLETLLTMPTK